MPQLICITCGKKFSVSPYRQNARYCSKKCAGKRPQNIEHCRQIIKLRKYPKTKRRFNTDWQREAEIALQSTNYRCVKCGKSLKLVKSSVHHIIPYWLTSDKEYNLPLCQSCHTELEHILTPCIKQLTNKFLEKAVLSFTI